jgi:hypothetical protein
VILLMAVAGCEATAPPVPVASPAPLAPRQADAKGFSEGYRAGALAQALRDQARARLAASALSKSGNGTLIFLPPISLPAPSPAGSMQDSATPAGPAVPLDKEWLPF